MPTIAEAMDLYYKLSFNDRITFYATLSNTIHTDGDDLQGFLMETRFADSRVCIYCESSHIVKNGRRSDGTQRFLCRDCGRTFVPASGTVSSWTHKRLSVWKKYIDCMMDKKTLKVSAEECGISMGTAFAWRHKILDSLQRMADHVILGGTVEADETFVNVSFKGNHHGKNGFRMPKESHKRGNDIHTGGLSDDKVCILCAVDPAGIPVSKAGKTGKVSSACVEKVLADRIRPDSILCTDNEKAYLRYAKEHGLCLIQMETDRRTAGQYTIQRINAYHSHLKGFLSCFGGVSSKYLNNYLAWYNLFFCTKKERRETAALILGQALTERMRQRYRDIPVRDPVPSLG